jgi:hypothetical protein
MEGHTDDGLMHRRTSGVRTRVQKTDEPYKWAKVSREDIDMCVGPWLVTVPLF